LLDGAGVSADGPGFGVMSSSAVAWSEEVAFRVVGWADAAEANKQAQMPIGIMSRLRYSDCS